MSKDEKQQAGVPLGDVEALDNMRRAYHAALRERDALRDERNELLDSQSGNELAGELARVLLTERAKFRDEVVEALLGQARYLRALRARSGRASTFNALAQEQIASTLANLARRLTRPDTSKREGPLTRAAEFVQRYGVDPERILEQARAQQERILEAPVQAGAAWDATLPRVASASPSWDAPLPGEVAHGQATWQPHAPEAPPEAEPRTWEALEAAKPAGQGAEQAEQPEQAEQDPYRVLISRADLRELLDAAPLDRSASGYHDRPLYKRAQELVSGPAHHCPASAPQGGSGALGAAQGQPEPGGRAYPLGKAVSAVRREFAQYPRSAARDAVMSQLQEAAAALSAKLERVTWERDEYRRVLGLPDDKPPPQDGPA